MGGRQLMQLFSSTGQSLYPHEPHVGWHLHPSIGSPPITVKHCDLGPPAGGREVGGSIPVR